MIAGASSGIGTCYVDVETKIFPEIEELWLNASGKISGKRSHQSIFVTPLALDEFNGPRGDFYKNMFVKCPAGRPGTADEVANVAELLMSDKGAFISGSTFLIDGGSTASYFYGPLKPGVEGG